MPNITDTVTTADGAAPVRLFTPDGEGPWPGVVMIPDAGGVRQTFFDMAAKLADSGYAVLLPDVYYRQGDWAPFDMKTAFSDENERNRLYSFIGSITPDKWALDAGAYFDYLAARLEVTGAKFGITGYCMGGRAALIVAGLLPDRVAAAASFHGGGLVTEGDDSPHRAIPDSTAEFVFGHADQDRSMPIEAVQQLEETLQEADRPHLNEIYQGAAHGYTMADTSTFDEVATERHFTALQALLQRTID